MVTLEHDPVSVSLHTDDLSFQDSLITSDVPLYKVTVLGTEDSSGKLDVLRQFVAPYGVPAPESTPFTVQRKTVVIAENRFENFSYSSFPSGAYVTDRACQVELWTPLCDSAHNMVRPLFYPATDAFVLVFSILDLDSFLFIQDILEGEVSRFTSFQSHVDASFHSQSSSPGRSLRRDIPVILIGNHSEKRKELPTSALVSTEMAIEFAKRTGCAKYIEICSYNRSHIEEALTHAVRAISTSRQLAAPLTSMDFALEYSREIRKIQSYVTPKPPKGFFDLESRTFIIEEEEDNMYLLTWDGSVPSLQSTRYQGPLHLSLPYPKVIRVVSLARNRFPSRVFSFSVPLETPPAEGHFDIMRRVLVLQTNPLVPCIYRYTTDGREPSSDSPLYHPGGIQLPKKLQHIVKVVARETDKFASRIAHFQPPLSLPAPKSYCKPVAGTNGAYIFTVQDQIPGYEYRYTTDGSEPSYSSPIYTSPISFRPPLPTSIRLAAFPVYAFPSNTVTVTLPRSQVFESPKDEYEGYRDSDRSIHRLNGVGSSLNRDFADGSASSPHSHQNRLIYGSQESPVVDGQQSDYKASLSPPRPSHTTSYESRSSTKKILNLLNSSTPSRPTVSTDAHLSGANPSRTASLSHSQRQSSKTRSVSPSINRLQRPTASSLRKEKEEKDIKRDTFAEKINQIRNRSTPIVKYPSTKNSICVGGSGPIMRQKGESEARSTVSRPAEPFTTADVITTAKHQFPSEATVESANEPSGVVDQYLPLHSSNQVIDESVAEDVESIEDVARDLNDQFAEQTLEFAPESIAVSTTSLLNASKLRGELQDQESTRVSMLAGGAWEREDVYRELEPNRELTVILRDRGIDKNVTPVTSTIETSNNHAVQTPSPTHEHVSTLESKASSPSRSETVAKSPEKEELFEEVFDKSSPDSDQFSDEPVYEPAPPSRQQAPVAASASASEIDSPALGPDAEQSLDDLLDELALGPLPPSVPTKGSPRPSSSPAAAPAVAAAPAAAAAFFNTEDSSFPAGFPFAVEWTPDEDPMDPDFILADATTEGAAVILSFLCPVILNRVVITTPGSGQGPVSFHCTTYGYGADESDVVSNQLDKNLLLDVAGDQKFDLSMKPQGLSCTMFKIRFTSIHTNDATASDTVSVLAVRFEGEAA